MNETVSGATEAQDWIVHDGVVYTPKAQYFRDADMLEYVRTDALSYSHRVDRYLSLVFSVKDGVLIGFKIKGFRYFFEAKLNKHSDQEFLDLVEVLKEISKELGNAIFNSVQIDSDYREAMSIAIVDNVTISLKSVA